MGVRPGAAGWSRLPVAPSGGQASSVRAAPAACLLRCAALCRHHKKEGEYPWLVKGLADYYRQHREQLPRVIWRDNSPQHFDIEVGWWWWWWWWLGGRHVHAPPAWRGVLVVVVVLAAEVWEGVGVQSRRLCVRVRGLAGGLVERPACGWLGAGAVQNGEFPHPSVAWKVLAHAKGCKPIKVRRQRRRGEGAAHEEAPLAGRAACRLPRMPGACSCLAAGSRLQAGAAPPRLPPPRRAALAPAAAAAGCGADA